MLIIFNSAQPGVHALTILSFYRYPAVIQDYSSCSILKMNSTLHNNRYACLREEVVFRCEMSGPYFIIAWKSDEYIGEYGQELSFGTFDVVGTMKFQFEAAYAVLVHKLESGNITYLVSEFHISASVDSNVTCLVGPLIEKTINFQIMKGI